MCIVYVGYVEWEIDDGSLRSNGAAFKYWNRGAVTICNFGARFVLVKVHQWFCYKNSHSNKADDRWGGEVVINQKRVHRHTFLSNSGGAVVNR
jgi:hypothetical protein